MKLHHVGLASRDLDRAVAFYCGHFGGKVLREFEWQRGNEAFNLRLGLPESAGRIVLIEFAGAFLEIFEFTVPEAGMAGEEPDRVSDPGFSHIGFVTGDCHGDYQRLKAAGVAFHAPPLQMPAGGIFAYARDLDGNIIEILQPPPAKRPD